MATMRDDLVHRLRDAGYDDVEVRVELQPGLVERLDHRARPRRAGRARHLAAGPAPPRRGGPVAADPAADAARGRAARGAARPTYALTSEFGATACKALYRCTACLEPFEHVKEI